MPETMTDIDGNTYGTVTIGPRVWMKANLRTTHYNDGTEIPNVTEDEAWGALTTGAYCWYNNDISNKTPYGAIYNWYAANINKLCPTGWHVPSHQEWSDMSYELGPSIAGGKMKTPGGWLEPNVGATNESGFTAYPAGKRTGNDEFVGAFSGIEIITSWWSSSEFSTDEAYYTYLSRSYSDMWCDKNGYKSTGFSVRCIKDRN